MMNIGAPQTIPINDHWLRQAIGLARYAEARGEVPVGAVLVRDNELIAEGFNQPILTCDPTAHAEIVALRAGAKRLNNYRLLETTLYVTLEPCVMCLGALVHARVTRLVFGCFDPRAGAIQTAGLLSAPYFNHQIEVVGGVLADECSALLKDFFAKRRG